VAASYLAGKTQWEIAKEEDVDHTTVSRDLAAVRKDWRESAAMDFGERVAEELAKLGKVEADAWAAWEKSKRVLCKRSREKTVGGRNDGAVRTTERRENRDGDPAFLKIILQCWDRRVKLLDLVPASKLHIGGDKGAAPVGVTADANHNVKGDLHDAMERYGALYDQMVAAAEAAGPTPCDDAEDELPDRNRGEDGL
jgi:hypothetical protein